MASTAITPTHLDNDTFANKVLADGLQVLTTHQYLFAWGKGADREVLYRTYNNPPKRYWAYTNRFTETNAGGGNHTITITPVASSVLRLVSMCVQMCNAGGARTTTVRVYDEDGNVKCRLAGAGLDDQSLSIPSIGGTSTTADNVAESLGLEVQGDGSTVRVEATALAQNEYLDVRMTWELIGTSTAATITHASTGTASTGTATQDEVTEVPVV